MPNSPKKKYWAFVSYSSKDAKWGKWLHNRLENYPIPTPLRGRKLFDGSPLGKNLRPCFLDREVLTGAPELGPAILKGLRESRYLIVLCSPHSAQSKWVNKEIEDFRALGGEKRILALILDGEPNATSNPNSANGLECFPKSLRYPNEPLAGDLRESGDGKERGFLKILAGAAELSFTELYNRHRRARRKKLITLFAVAATVILSLVALTLFALNQRSQRDLALAEAKLNARARYEAEISKASTALENGSTVSALRALAGCPEEQKGWEWQYLNSLCGPAPLKLATSEIEFLDLGPLQGSGLLGDAQKLLAGDGFATPSFQQAGPVQIGLYHGGRGGGGIAINRPPLDTLTLEVGTDPYGAPGEAIVSSDGSCLLVLSDSLRTASFSTSQSKPGSTLYIFPIPKNKAYLPGSASQLSLASSGDVILASSGGNLLIKAQREETQLDITLSPIRDNLMKESLHFATFISNLGSETRDKTLRFLYADSDETPTSAHPHALIDYRLHQGIPELLTYSNNQIFLTTLPSFEQKNITSLDPTSSSIWNSHFNLSSYTSGGALLNDQVFLCPYKEDRSAVISLSGNQQPLPINGKFTFAENDSVRPGSSSWDLSPDGTLVSTVVYEAPGASFLAEVCDTKTGETIWSDYSGATSRVEWSRDGSLFATLSTFDREIRVYEGPGKTLLTAVPVPGYIEGPLLQVHPNEPDLIIIGHTLMSRSKFRPLLTFPQNFTLSEDWTFAAFHYFGETSSSQHIEQDIEPQVLIHFVDLNGAADASQANLLQQFQLEVIRQQGPNADPTSPLHPETLQKIASINAGQPASTEDCPPLLELTVTQADTLKTRSSDLSFLATRPPNPTELQQLCESVSSSEKIHNESGTPHYPLESSIFLALSQRESLQQSDLQLLKKFKDIDLAQLLLLRRHDSPLPSVVPARSSSDEYTQNFIVRCLVQAAQSLDKEKSDQAKGYLALASTNREGKVFLDRLIQKPEIASTYFWFSLLDQPLQEALLEAFTIPIPASSIQLALLTREITDSSPDLAFALANAHPILPPGNDFPFQESLNHYQLLAKLSTQLGHEKPNIYLLHELSDFAPKASPLKAAFLIRGPEDLTNEPPLEELDDSPHGITAGLVYAYRQGDVAAISQIFPMLIEKRRELIDINNLRAWAFSAEEEDILCKILGTYLLKINPPLSIASLQGFLLTGQSLEASALADQLILQNKQIPPPLLKELILVLVRRDVPVREPNPHFDAALKAMPDDPSILRLVAYHRFVCQQLDEAVLLWTKIVSENPAAASFESSNEFHTEQKIPHRTRDDSSLHPFSISISILRSFTPPELISDPTLLCDLARGALSFNALEIGQDKADFFLKRSLSISPNHRQTHEIIARLHRENGDTELAITHLQRALKSPPSEDAYNTITQDLVSLLIEESRFEEALQTLDPEDSDAEYQDHEAILTCLLKLGRQEEATSFTLQHLSTDSPSIALNLVNEIIAGESIKDLTALILSLMRNNLTSFPDPAASLSEGTPKWHQADLAVSAAIRAHQLGKTPLARDLLLQQILNAPKSSQQHFIALAAISWKGPFKQFATNLWFDHLEEMLVQGDTLRSLPPPLSPLLPTLTAIKTHSEN